jgi:hypothetical protein
MFPAGMTLVLALLAAAFLKAGLVMAYYMHLKEDSRVYAGIVLLAAVVLGYFLVMVAWPAIT